MTTKAQWAAKKAAELRKQADDIPRANTHDWRRVRRRTQAATALHRRAARLERLARVAEPYDPDSPF